MRRRTFLTGFAASLVIPFSARGENPSKVFRLGVLAPSPRTLDIVRSVLLPELGRLGFVEGANLALDFRSGAEADLERLAGEIVARGADAIMAVAGEAAKAARQRTGTTPIVMFGGEDGIIEGLATTLARPGSNVTAVVIMTSQLDSKRLYLLHEAAPSLSRVAALLYDSDDPPRNRQKEELSRAAAALGLQLQFVAARVPTDVPAVFEALRSGGAQALLIGAHARLFQFREALTAAALDARLPTVCEWSTMARDGCLIGYGPDREALYRSVALKLARIFGGASPADLPIEQPTSFNMAVNLNTAKAVGIDLPPSILGRADEVIE